MIQLAKRHIVIVGIVLAIIIGIFLMRKEEFQESENDLEPMQTVELQEEVNVEPTDTKIMVDIKGEIEKPGVYEIEQGTRVIDIIQAAGGFTEEADEKQINLAQKVQDEMVVIVPKIGEESAELSLAGQQNEKKLKINQATKEEIVQLNGIGPTKAQAIIDYREENGLFQQEDDLLNVNGIGEKTLENLKDYIIIP